MHSQLIQTRFTGIQDLTLALDMVALVLEWVILTGIHVILHTWAIPVTDGVTPDTVGVTRVTAVAIRDMGRVIRVILYIPAIHLMVITTMAQGLQIQHRDA